MAEKLNSDMQNFDFGDLDDLNFDDEISGSINQEAFAPAGKRGVVTNVIKGVGSGIVDTATSGSFIRQTMRKSLPENYGEIADGLGAVHQTIDSLQNEVSQELKPRIGSIVDKLDQLVPEESTRLKKGMEKIKNWAGIYTHQQTDRESQEDSMVNASLSMFAQEQEQRKADEKKQIVKDGIEQKRFNVSAKLLEDISESTTKTALYTLGVNQAYQKKSLEIQLRSYYTQQKFVTDATGSLQAVVTQLEAIVKNTAMPEYVKITNSERFIEAGKRKFLDGLYGEGSVLRQGLDRIKDMGMQAVSGFARAMDQAEFGLDGAVSAQQTIAEMNEMLESMGEPPLTKAELAGAQAGSMTAEWIQGIFTKRIRNLTDKDRELRRGLAKGASFLSNPAIAIQKFINSDEITDGINEGGVKGRLFEIVKMVGEQFYTGKNSDTIKGTMGKEDLREVSMGFDKKAHLTLVDVIPGHLSGIRRELTMIRTGDENVDSIVYDYNRREFVGSKVRGQRSVEKLKSVANKSMVDSATGRVADDFIGDIQVDEIVRFELKRFFLKASRYLDMHYTAENIKDTPEYEALSVQAKTIVDHRLDMMSMSEVPEEELHRLNKRMDAVRRATPNFANELQGVYDSGDMDYIAESTGLVSRSEDGDWDLDQQKLDDWLLEHGILGSDTRTKRAIKRMDPTQLYETLARRWSTKKWRTKTQAEMVTRGLPVPKSAEEAAKGPQSKMGLMGERLKAGVEAINQKRKDWHPQRALEGIRNTKLYQYLYKDGMGDDEEHVGPMAQDVQDNLGDEAAPQGKVLDVQSMVGASMAAIQGLDEKVREAFKKDTSGEPRAIQLLDSINKHTKRLESMDDLNKKVYASMTSGEATGTNVVLTGNQQTTFGYAGEFVADSFKAASDAVSTGVSKLWEHGSKGAVGGFNFIRDLVTDKESWLRKGLSVFGEKTMSLGGWIMDGIKDTVTKRIPEGFRSLKELGKSAWDSLNDQLLEWTDLYILGENSPAIRVKNLARGLYYDAETGEPIVTMKGILEAKKGIVDKAGNIVVSAEKLAAGLYNRHGKKVKTLFKQGMDKVVGLGIKGYRGVRTALSKAGGFLSGLGSRIWGGMKSFGESFSETDFFGGNSHQVLVDIRDILLGNKKEVADRLQKEDPLKKFVNLDSVSDKLKDGIITKLFGDKEEIHGPHLPEMHGPHMPGHVGSMRGLGSSIKKIFDKSEKGRSWRDIGGGIRDRIGESSIGQRTGGMMDGVRNSRIGRSRAGRGIGTAIGVGRGLATTGLNAITGAADTAMGFFKDATDSGPGRTSDDERQAYNYMNDPRVPALLKRKPVVDATGKVHDANSSEARAQQLEALKASRRNTVEGDMGPRYKSATNVVDALMGAVASAAGKIKDTIGDMLGLGMDAVEDYGYSRGGRRGRGGRTRIPRSRRGGAGRISDQLAKRGTRRATTQATKQVGKQAAKRGLWTAARQGLWTAGRFVTTKALPWLATGVSTVVSTVGLPVIIGAALVATAAYGTYKLYQYANRNTMSPLEEIRLRQYGLGHNEEVSKFNHRAYVLEAYLEDGFTQIVDGKAIIDDAKLDMAEVVKAAGIDPESEEEVSQFRYWFDERFRFFYLAHKTALHAVKPDHKLGNVDKLNPQEKLAYVSALPLTGGNYNYIGSPFKEVPELTTDKATVLNLIDIEKSRLNKNLGKKDDKRAEEVDEKLKDTSAELEASRKASIAASREFQKKRNEEKLKQIMSELEQLQRDDMLDKDGNYEGPIPGSAAYEEYKRKHNSQMLIDDGKEGEDPKTHSSPPEMEKHRTQTNSAVPSSGIPMAGGPLLDGLGASQYLKLQPGVKLEGIHPRMLKHFLAMVQEYGEKTGKSIQVNDGFRTYEDQVRMKQKYGDRAATPGKSLHESGLAIDIHGPHANELEKMGLMKKYGFTRPVGGERWHIEPAGTQKNFQLARNNPAEADAMIVAGLGRGGGGYGTDPNATKYRRNHDLAMRLLNAEPMMVTEEDVDESLKDVMSPAISTEVASSTPEASSADVGSQQSMSTTSDMAAMDPPGAGGMDSFGSTTNQQHGTGGTGATHSGPQGTLADLIGESEMETAGTEITGSAGEETGIKKIISDNARRAGEDPGLMQTMAMIESSMNPNAKASTSSASGLFQFINATWQEMVSRHGGKYGLRPGVSPFDPAASTLMAAEYIKGNKKILRTVKPNPDAVDVYLAHFLGPGGARTFLKANPNAIAAQIMPKAANANKSIFYDKSGRPRTIAEVYKDIANRVATKAKQAGLHVSSSGSMPTPPSTGQQGSAGMSELGITDNDDDGFGLGSVMSSMSGGGDMFSSMTQGLQGMLGGFGASTGGGGPLGGLSSLGGSLSGAMSNLGGNLTDSMSQVTQNVAGGFQGASEGMSGMHPLASPGIEKNLEDSLKVQTDMLTVLQAIQENTDVNKLAEVLVGLLAKDDAEDAQTQEDRRLGRSSETRNSSLNISRGAA